jgi:hypothetical protein
MGRNCSTDVVITMLIYNSDTKSQISRSCWMLRTKLKNQLSYIYIYTHRVSQKERSVPLEVTVSVILSKKCICTLSHSERFPS